MATGGAHAPIKDSKSRPITAGGFVDGAPVVFIDITKEAGLDKFHHRSGGSEKSTIIDAPGSGVALLDYDNDGWLDIVAANGAVHLIEALRQKVSLLQDTIALINEMRQGNNAAAAQLVNKS